MNTAVFLVRVLMGQRMKVWSWGIHSLTSNENGISFKVQGFKFVGKVHIDYDQGLDLWSINFVKNGKSVKSIEGVYTEDLVDTIDREVEYTGACYENDVKQWLRGAAV